MIRSFKHKGLERFFTTNSKKGIQSGHAKKLTAQLTALHLAKVIGDMDVESWKLHPLQGNRAGYWSVKVDGNWRLIFRFAGTDAEQVDYLDYH